MADLEEITGGYSGAELFRIRTGREDYTVKIMPKRLGEGSARRVQEICKIYQENRIDSLTFRGYGELDDERHFYVYDYIEGESFKGYSEQKLNQAEIRTAGEELGRKLRSLKEAKNYDVSLIRTDDVKCLTLSGQELYKSLTNDASMDEMWQNYFDMQQLQEMMEEFTETTKDFCKVEPKLIHGDLKRSNLVQGRDGKTYLIDIESMRKSYDVLNLRYQMTWILFPEAENEREFVRGIFDGLYGEERPEGFDRQVRYVLMLNFLEHTHKAWQRSEDLKEYFTKMQTVFAKIKDTGTQSLL